MIELGHPSRNPGECIPAEASFHGHRDRSLAGNLRGYRGDMGSRQRLASREDSPNFRNRYAWTESGRTVYASAATSSRNDTATEIQAC
jgi:hypothetical protein